jgi:prevent-host-death family protein
MQAEVRHRNGWLNPWLRGVAVRSLLSMVTVGVREAASTLSELLRRAEAGEEVIIRRGNEPVARLVPFRPTSGARLGCDAGVFTVPEDFDEPLPEDLFGRIS